MSEKKASRKSNSPQSISDPMDAALLERLVKLMQANDLNALELRDGDKRVVLKRGPANVPIQIAAPAAPMTPGKAPAEVAAPADENAGLIAIKSPMVGTYYSAPSPDAKPFVSVGSPVSEDTDVCVIEAMKVFNNVKAECHGTISKILVNNGQAVEFNQVLFLVKP